ncbi:MAG: hypothetical protein ABIE84_02770, partial [bacterium]
ARIETLLAQKQRVQIPAERLCGETLRSLQADIKSTREKLTAGTFKKVQLATARSGLQDFEVRRLQEADLSYFAKAWSRLPHLFALPSEAYAEGSEAKREAILGRTLIVFGSRPFPGIQSYVRFSSSTSFTQATIQRLENAHWNKGDGRLTKGTTTLLHWVMLENSILDMVPGEVPQELSVRDELHAKMHHSIEPSQRLRRQIFFDHELTPLGLDSIEALINLRLMACLRIGESVSLDELADAAGVSADVTAHILQKRLETWDRLT